MKKHDFGCSLLMGVLRDNHSVFLWRKWIISNTETLSMVLEGLEKLYRKSGSWSPRSSPKVSKTGLTFFRTILVIARTSATLSPLNGHLLIILCLTNSRSRSIMLYTIARSSKSLETSFQGKMCREGVKQELLWRIFRYWQDFRFEWAALLLEIVRKGPHRKLSQ